VARVHDIIARLARADWRMESGDRQRLRAVEDFGCDQSPQNLTIVMARRRIVPRVPGCVDAATSASAVKLAA
jgi:hypothetical protein